MTRWGKERQRDVRGKEENKQPKYNGRKNFTDFFSQADLEKEPPEN